MSKQQINFQQLKQSILDAFYPIGSLYFNATNSSNPSSILGFGTWVAYAKGEAIVGKAASGTFATAGTTGGEETHLLTGAESGTSIHSHTTNFGSTPGGAGNGLVYGTTTGNNQNILVLNSTAANASSAHNNLQPYVVAYVWERTA